MDNETQTVQPVTDAPKSEFKRTFRRGVKIFIGAAAIIVVAASFFASMHSSSLESGDLRTWKKAPVERRAAAVRVLTAGADNNDLLVACVDKIASLDGADEMAVRDAVSLCYTGAQIKQYQ